jgi:hypothetical protein
MQVVHTFKFFYCQDGHRHRCSCILTMFNFFHQIKTVFPSLSILLINTITGVLRMGNYSTSLPLFAPLLHSRCQSPVPHFVQSLLGPRIGIFCKAPLWPGVI